MDLEELLLPYAEIPSDIDIMEIHNTIDIAEREVSRYLNIHLVIHMDPICVITDEIKEAWDCVEKILRRYPEIKSMHDFRIVGEGDYKNLIFDIVVSPSSSKNVKKQDKMLEDIKNSIREEHPQYNCVITLDYDYM